MKVLCHTIVLILWLCVGFLPEQCFGQRAKDLCDQGIWYLRSGDKQKAIESFKYSIDADKKYADAWYYLGFALSVDTVYKGAMKALRKAEKLGYGSDAIYQQGRILDHYEKEKAAGKRFSRCLRADSSYRNAWIALGLYDFRRFNFKSAYDRLSKAQKLNPLDPDIYLKLGYCAQYLGKYEMAEGLFSKGIQLDADNPELYFARGSLRQERKEFYPAVEDYNLVIELAPDDWRGYNYRAQVYSEIGFFNQVEKDLNQARLTGTYPEDFKQITEMYVANELEDTVRYQNLLVDFRQSYPRDMAYYYYDAQLNFQLGKYKAGEQSIRRLLKKLVSPDYDAYLLAGKLYAKLGNERKAREYLLIVKECRIIPLAEEAQSLLATF